MNKDQCWFKNSKFCENANCDIVCKYYDNLHQIFMLSNLPEQYWFKLAIFPNIDDNSYKRLAQIKDDIDNWGQNGNNLYIWSSNYQNAKTSWEIKLIQSYANCFIEYHFDKPLIYFLPYIDLQDAFQGQVNDPDKFNKLKDVLFDTELVAWDNIDLICNNVKLQELVGLILDKRMMNKKSNIFTSHISPQQFNNLCQNKLLGSKITLCESIQFIAPPYTMQNNSVGGGK